MAATAVVVVAVAEVEVLVLSDSLSVVDGLLELVEDVGSADSVVRVLVCEDVVVLDVDVLDVDPDSDLLSSPAPKPTVQPVRCISTPARRCRKPAN